VVVANPPFSLDKWGHEEAGVDPFQRFHRGLPPRSKGDYAFISHMIETTTADSGRVAVVVPHGVLFRGASEGKIRRSLIEENLLDAVIGLPANLFFGTGIPAAVLVFRRGKTDDSVLFIDGSRGYEDGKNQNRLRKGDVERIVGAYKARVSVERFAYLASGEEVRGNEFNLNIPRYVDTFEEEAVDINAIQKEIRNIEISLSVVGKEMENYLKDLNCGR